MYYDLDHGLTQSSKVQGLARGEIVYGTCRLLFSVEELADFNQLLYIDPHSILRPPQKKTFRPNNSLRWSISGYFKQLLPKLTRKQIGKALPQVMPSWGKVRIAQGGDCIHTSSASSNPDQERNMSYVRVSPATLMSKHIDIIQWIV
jgi:hypothetical protein